MAEIVDRSMRRHGISREASLEQADALLDVPVVGLPIDIPTARLAGEIRATYYSRDGTALSLADCLLLAGAEEEDEIATADAAVVDTARTLRIGVIPLLDSRGRRPQ